MDSVTQALLGATIAEAGFRKRLGGRAVAWGAICGTAPDLDLVAALGGQWSNLVHHRGASHSLLVLSALSPVVGYFGYRWFRAKARDSPHETRTRMWLRWSHLSFWALITHPLLDVCTAYGTQLLAPISRERFAIDAVAIVDPAYTLPLFLAILFAWRSQNRARSAAIARGALVLTTLYLALGFILSQQARAIAWSDLRNRGFEAVEVRALPTVLNTLVYRVVARDAEDRMRIGYYSHTQRHRPEWIALERSRDPLIAQADRDERVGIFRWFAMGYSHAEVRYVPSGYRLEYHDQRYGSLVHPECSFWRTEVEFDYRGQLRDVTYVQSPGGEGLGQEVGALWTMLRGDRLPPPEEPHHLCNP